MGGVDLAEQAQNLETATIDLQLRRAWEAKHAVCERVKEVHHVLRHGRHFNGLVCARNSAFAQ